MAVLTAKMRRLLPGSSFAIPGERRYPIHDLLHARLALALVSRHGTPGEQRLVGLAIKRRWPALAARSGFLRRILEGSK